MDGLSVFYKILAGNIVYYLLFSLLSFFLISMSFTVFFINRKSRINRFFALHTFFFAIWSIIMTVYCTMGIQVARLAGIPDHVIRRAKKILYSIENEGQDLTDAFSGQETENTGAVQMDLFSKKEHFFVEKLSKLDISKMTPLEALNYLNELRQKAKDITH